MFHIEAINLKILGTSSYGHVNILLVSSTIIISNYFHGLRVSQNLYLALKHLFHIFCSCNI